MTKMGYMDVDKLPCYVGSVIAFLDNGPALYRHATVLYYGCVMQRRAAWSPQYYEQLMQQVHKWRNH